MKKEIKSLAAFALVLSAFVCVNNVVNSEVTPEKVAVVDVASVVSQSQQVKALKNEQTRKAQELAKWLNVVRADIDKQTTPEGKAKLTKKYDAELAKKREANTKDYAKKLANIDRSISTTIETQAKAKGYTLVLAKSTVLYGGDDITAEVAKFVK